MSESTKSLHFAGVGILLSASTVYHLICTVYLFVLVSELKSMRKSPEYDYIIMEFYAYESLDGMYFIVMRSRNLSRRNKSTTHPVCTGLGFVWGG